MAVFSGIGFLLMVCIGLSLLLADSCDTKVYHQTAKDISTSYNALIDLFDCIGSFLKRLQIHKSFSTGMTEIAVRIMAELLSVLALATKQVKTGRFSEFFL